LDEQLKTGLIVESKSTYVAPCFYIPKKDGSLQLVQDYRKLNQVMIKDKTPLPLIGEVIDKLKEVITDEVENLLNVKFTNSGLSVFLYFIHFHFYFIFILFSYFSIFRTTRVRVRSDLSHCHISHNLMV